MRHRITSFRCVEASQKMSPIALQRKTCTRVKFRQTLCLRAAARGQARAVIARRDEHSLWKFAGYQPSLESSQSSWSYAHVRAYVRLRARLGVASGAGRLRDMRHERRRSSKTARRSYRIFSPVGKSAQPLPSRCLLLDIQQAICAFSKLSPQLPIWRI